MSGVRIETTGTEMSYKTLQTHETGKNAVPNSPKLTDSNRISQIIQREDNSGSPVQ